MGVLSSVLAAVMALSSVQDSVKVASNDEKTIMLNAESASKPREINIGFSTSGDGAIVYIDGTKHSYGILKGYWHWPGGNSYQQNGVINLLDAVITTGEIAVVLDSHTKLGGDNLAGTFTVGSSTNGLIRVDGNLSGPLAKGKGWYYSLGAFASYDPTSVNAPSRMFIDQRQIYQGAVSKKWTNASLDMIYRFSLCNDAEDGGYNVAPFLYNGDGSIGALNGFRLGRDCYFPANDYVEYIDVVTGQKRTGYLGQMNRRYTHDLTVKGLYHHQSGWDLGANLHVCYMQPSQSVAVSMTGIDQAGEGSLYSVENGSPFVGNVQNRTVHVDDENQTSVELNLSAVRALKHHNFRLGLSLVYTDQYEAGSSFAFAHDVAAGPSRLLKDGQMTWNYNTSGRYYDAWRTMAAFYGIHDWTPVERLLVRTGVRLKPYYQEIFSAARLQDDPEGINKRVNGFYVSNPAMCNLHNLKQAGFDYSFSEHIKVRLVDRLYFMAEGFYSMTGKNPSYFRNASIPTVKPIGNAYARGGLAYDNPWMDATALVSYITNWNAASVMTVTKQINGVSETIPWTAQYGIGTLGVTGDANFHIGGFNMHLRATWQDPRYKNYHNEFVFSDNSKTVIDYTGNYVTGISQVMLEFDPSYKWKNVRLWASARYYSKQYASRTNLAWFNGHWETFAGVDWQVIKSLKLSVNVVNALFQDGAKGSIDIADTITDSSALNGYVMSGTYIRPFTVDFMLTYKF